ncbi:MAG TPA: hypothetical protein VF965_03755 [Candidatus Limnocylindria bacterium]
MRKLKTILVALVVVASLYAASGTAWARTESGQRGTAWTDVEDTSVLDGPTGVSWEGLDF